LGEFPLLQRKLPEVGKSGRGNELRRMETFYTDRMGWIHVCLLLTVQLLTKSCFLKSAQSALGFSTDTLRLQTDAEKAKPYHAVTDGDMVGTAVRRAQRGQV
jgi:hypothetical protein